MARKQPDPEDQQPARGAGAPPEPQPAPPTPKPVKPKNTPEKDRHSPFFKIMKLWRLLHDDGGRTTFTKEELAKRYFPQNEADPDPEEVPYAAGEEVDDEDLDYADFQGGVPDGLDDLDVEDPAEEAPYGSGRASGDTLSFARQPGEQPRKRNKKPHRSGWPSEKQKQDVTRYLRALQNEGIAIWNVVLNGEVEEQLDDDQFEEWHKTHPSAERRWKYDPDGYWAKELDHLFNEYGIQGYELVGILALQEMLSAMDGSPQHAATNELIGKLVHHVPEPIFEDAREKARAWRYSVGNIRKYSTESRKRALAAWHRATIDRVQVIIEHQTPGKPLRPRRIAALGTMFDREENSIYFLGSEYLGKGPVEADGSRKDVWKRPVQWKFDRVKSVTPLEDANPSIKDIIPHETVKEAPGGGPERLDIERLYSDSAGAFLRYDEPTIRLEILVHAPGWIAWCREKPFHPRQNCEMELDDDGHPRLRLIIERCHAREMRSRLLRLGGHLTVVSPQPVIDKMRATAQTIMRRH